MKTDAAKNFKCGMVSIVGRPNVGKSTLLNEILGEKVAIVSKVPQTTRNQIKGVYNDKRGQIIFIDTPGLRLGGDRLDKFMNKSSVGTIKNADCIIYLVDTSRRIGEEEMDVVKRLKTVNAPIILGLNKIDKRKTDTFSYISLWEDARQEAVTEMENFTLIALSGREGINIDKLLDVIYGYLPEGPALYPEDTICDMPQRLAISDIIREKLFKTMKQEIPHSIGVVIDEIRPVRKKTLLISALIFVERATQKEIVIGKNGQALRKVGTLARVELEDLLEAKVYLEFHVKVSKGWRDSPILLQELGYDESMF